MKLYLFILLKYTLYFYAASATTSSSQECGLKPTLASPLIVGGEPADVNEYPWAAAIYKNTTFICSGTIISPYHILTAGHCLYSGLDSNSSEYQVGVGKYDYSYSAQEGTAQMRHVKRIAVPPRFEGHLNNFFADIGILEVDSPLIFSQLVLPICIDWDLKYEATDLREGNKGEIIGWGLTNSEGLKNVGLKKLNVPYRTYNTCKKFLPESFVSIYFLNDKLCAGYVKGATSACNGDSGGGLFFKSDKTRYFLRGIVSIGPSDGGSCNTNSLQLYTKVSDYLSWIKEELLKNPKTNLNFVSKVDENLQNGCLLPSHAQYGTFSLSHQDIYIVNKLVPVSTLIILSCHHNSDGSRFFFCDNKKWTPSIETVKCKKPGTCPSIKTSISEEVVCKLNGIPVDCDEPETNTTAVIRCQPFFSFREHRPIYKCKNGTWDQTFIPCNPECGVKRVATNTLVIGGEETIENEYPWVVAIYNETNDQMCGGTIISRSFVLSAAHCFTFSDGKKKNKDNFLIGAGKFYRDFNKEESSAQFRKIKTLYIHEDYKGRLQKYRDDISLIKLEKAFTITAEVQPICLDWDNIYEDFDFIEGTEGIIAGWGNTQEGTSPSSVLKKLVMPYRSKRTCMRNLPEDYAQEFLASDKICAGYHNMSLGACNGDSGGGLYFKSDHGRYYLRGIVSITVKGSVGCDANYYTLFTKVSKYLSWAEAMTRRIL